MLGNPPVENLGRRESHEGDFILVGQQPSGNSPDNPLATDNPIWSGARLARMASLSGEDFERFFVRVNINYEVPADNKFRVNNITRSRAQKIFLATRSKDVIILLGSAVEKCFSGLLPHRWSVDDGSFKIGRSTGPIALPWVVVVPHPSGLNRYYNDPSNVARVGRFLNDCHQGRFSDWIK